MSCHIDISCRITPLLDWYNMTSQSSRVTNFADFDASIMASVRVDVRVGD
jgi:hypothetical protein